MSETALRAVTEQRPGPREGARRELGALVTFPGLWDGPPSPGWPCGCAESLGGVSGVRRPTAGPALGPHPRVLARAVPQVLSEGEVSRCERLRSLLSKDDLRYERDPSLRSQHGARLPGSVGVLAWRELPVLLLSGQQRYRRVLPATSSNVC